MKNILILLILVISISCVRHTKESSTTKPIPCQEQTYPDGSLVCVGESQFIVVDYYDWNNRYRLHLIGCPSESCYYSINESEIKKCD